MPVQFLLRREAVVAAGRTDPVDRADADDDHFFFFAHHFLASAGAPEMRQKIHVSSVKVEK